MQGRVELPHCSRDGAERGGAPRRWTILWWGGWRREPIAPSLSVLCHPLLTLRAPAAHLPGEAVLETLQQVGGFHALLWGHDGAEAGRRLEEAGLRAGLEAAREGLRGGERARCTRALGGEVKVSRLDG